MRAGHRLLTVGSVDLDDIDIQILNLLQDEGRISKSALASRVNLSNSACFERMRRLEELGVIASYHARINVLELGDPLLIQTHVILGSHLSGDFTRFEKRVSGESMVIECYALGGGIDYSLTICAMTMGEYQGLIDRLLDAEIGIQQYYTYIITKQVKRRDIRIENLIGQPARRR